MILSYDLFLILLIAVVGFCVYNQARLRNDIVNLQQNDIVNLQENVQATKRGLIRERRRNKQRGILRNRELMAVGKTLDKKPEVITNIDEATHTSDGRKKPTVEEAVEWSGASKGQSLDSARKSLAKHEKRKVQSDFPSSRQDIAHPQPRRTSKR